MEWERLAFWTNMTFTNWLYTVWFTVTKCSLVLAVTVVKHVFCSCTKLLTPSSTACKPLLDWTENCIYGLLINMCWDYWACLLETWLACWWYRIQLESRANVEMPHKGLCVLCWASTTKPVYWKLRSTSVMVIMDKADPACSRISHFI